MPDSINTTKLTQELLTAEIQTCGCNSNGTVWDKEGLEIQDREDVKLIIEAHDPSPDETSILREEYSKVGVTSEEMIFALWKKVMGSDSTDSDAIQSLIDQVNLEHS